METVTTASTEYPEAHNDPIQDHWECGACIVLALLAGYLWGLWDAYKPFRATVWNGKHEPLRHAGRVTLTNLQFRDLVEKGRRYDQAALMWPEVQKRIDRH